ncbi:hypothetical protein [Salarchaeum japonicum]|uniref:hypothetical protein n=1 Tax=Salarchaeum japonicum TaxID=555573 RepID=UPI003C70B82E
MTVGLSQFALANSVEFSTSSTSWQTVAQQTLQLGDDALHYADRLIAAIELRSSSASYSYTAFARAVVRERDPHSGAVLNTWTISVNSDDNSPDGESYDTQTGTQTIGAYFRADLEYEIEIQARQEDGGYTAYVRDSNITTTARRVL